ncbi:MAG: hypothetical protein NC301_02655 [Bacteroides sp.]|nr:hypothetical protein [Bacteroides sp.]MCM1379632.1 hypothetical protein [Bacteroides sp.]MCM1445986.1 hypothetical protein [Prevotella sp.]
MVVSAYEHGEALLGYSDAPADSSAMPPEMKYWLGPEASTLSTAKESIFDNCNKVA